MPESYYRQGFVLVFFCLLTLLPVFAGGETGDTPIVADTAYTLPPMVVSATRWEIPASEAASNIEVVTREEIESLPADTVAQVLKYQPGIYVEFNGGPGATAGPSIQGADFRHVTVYLDGVPLNFLSNPVSNLSNIPVTSVERIEVYKGAASSAWGSALGGVVNIITREPDANQLISGQARAGYGDYSTVKTDLTLRGTKDRYGYLVSLTRNESDGFISYTDYEQSAVYFKCHADLGETSRLGFIYSYAESRFSDSLPTLPEIWDDSREERSYQQVNFETALTDQLDVVLEARYHQFDAKIEDVFIDGGKRAIYADTEEERWGGGMRTAWRPDDIHTVTAGFDGDWGDYDFTGASDASATNFDTGNWAVYANDTLSLGRFSVQAGLRYDHNDEFGSQTSPSLGAVCRLPWFDALLRAQVAGGFSAPPANFIRGPDGNPDLKPEKAVNYQLGAEMRPQKWLHLSASLFHADIEDLIQFLREEGTSRGEFINIGEVRRRGVEGSMTADFACGLRLSFGGSFVDVQNEVTGKTERNIPRVTLNTEIAYTHQWLTHSLMGKYIDHNPSSDRKAGTKDRKFVFDYRLKTALPRVFDFGTVNAYLNVYNLFNVEYQYTNFWPQPDRWFEGGITIEL